MIIVFIDCQLVTKKITLMKSQSLSMRRLILFYVQYKLVHGKISGETCNSVDNSTKHIALVAQVLYDNGDDSNGWIGDNGSTHHMTSFVLFF